ncbi:hypothetical protein MEN24_09910, partial [Dolichospermum sp. ST_sed10]|nr:hypothetical protein [Dolichospermum sp. ST_sed10]
QPYFDFFLLVLLGVWASSLPNKYCVRSDTGKSLALLPLTSTKRVSCSKCAPSPWAIFRAASNSRT